MHVAATFLNRYHVVLISLTSTSTLPFLQIRSFFLTQEHYSQTTILVYIHTNIKQKVLFKVAMWIGILHQLFGFGLKFLAMFYTVNQHVAIANEYTMYLDVICFCGSLFSVCQQGGSGNACIVTPPFAQVSPSLSKNSVFLPIGKYVISTKHLYITSHPDTYLTVGVTWKLSRRWYPSERLSDWPLGFEKVLLLLSKVSLVMN